MGKTTTIISTKVFTKKSSLALYHVSQVGVRLRVCPQSIPIHKISNSRKQISRMWVYQKLDETFSKKPSSLSRRWIQDRRRTNRWIHITINSKWILASGWDKKENNLRSVRCHRLVKLALLQAQYNSKKRNTKWKRLTLALIP